MSRSVHTPRAVYGGTHYELDVRFVYVVTPCDKTKTISKHLSISNNTLQMLVYHANLLTRTQICTKWKSSLGKNEIGRCYWKQKCLLT